MGHVEIETPKGSFNLEVGENSRAFLWLFNLTQSELEKAEMSTEIVTRLVVKYSGSDPRRAKSFVSTVAEAIQGEEPEKGWGIWAGRYAKKCAAEKCKKDIKTYSIPLIIGAIGLVALIRSNPSLEMGLILQIVLLVRGLLTIFGLYQVSLFAMDLFQFRGGSWPEINGKD